MSDQKQTKIWGFDWLRAAGALAVIVLHVLVSYSHIPAHAQQYAQIIGLESLISVPLTRWAVPVFFMISGALLLNPNKNLSPQKWSKHLLRIVLILATVGTFFALLEAYFYSKTINLALFVTAGLNVLKAKSWDHLWYLYATLAFYLCLHPLRKFCEKSSATQIGATASVLLLTFAVAHAFFYLPELSTYVPTTVLESPIATFVQAQYWLPYVLLGYLARTKNFKVGKVSIALAVLSPVLMYIGVTHFTFFINVYALPEYGLVAAPSYILFCVAGKIKSAPKAVQFLSDHSLNLYLFHPLFMHLWLIFGPETGIFLSQFVLLVIGFVGSLAISLVLKRIPGLNKVF